MIGFHQTNAVQINSVSGNAFTTEFDIQPEQPLIPSVIRGQVRHSDLSIGIGSHGRKCCPHPIVTTWILGSPNVITNGRESIRGSLDIGIHTCPHCGISMPINGSPNVIMNNFPAHRTFDMVNFTCGCGLTILGSSDTIVN